MDFSSTLFWNVDTQNDFVEHKGKFHIKCADKIKPLWAEITRYARQKKIRVVNTANFHHIHSEEIVKKPDFITNFPPHCLANTAGAEFIKETEPENPIIFNCDVQYNLMPLQVEVPNYRNFVIRKDTFDVFAGNQVAENLLRILNPQVVIVYGVPTNISVDFAVRGLVKYAGKVIVLEDAIREYHKLPLPFDSWEKMGVSLMPFEMLTASLEK